MKSPRENCCKQLSSGDTACAANRRTEVAAGTLVDVLELVHVPCQECGVDLPSDSPDLRLELADGDELV
jgi:hypothetical protein